MCVSLRLDTLSIASVFAQVFHMTVGECELMSNVVFVFCKQKTFPCNFFANVQMNPSSEALQARADLNVTRPPVGLSPLAAAAAMGTADTVRAMLVARSEVNPEARRNEA